MGLVVVAVVAVAVVVVRVLVAVVKLLRFAMSLAHGCQFSC